MVRYWSLPVCNGDLTAMLAAGNRDVADGVAQPTAATT